MADAEWRKISFWERLSPLLLGLILLLFLVTACRGELPVVRSLVEIEAHHGQRVKVEGTYQHLDAGKCWIAQLILEDGTPVVIRYQPEEKETSRFAGQKVILTGTILRSYPSDERQYLAAPHLIGGGPLHLASP